MTPLALGVFVLIPRSIVAGVDHQRILGQLQLIQGIKQTTRFIIKLLHHIAVEATLGLPSKSRRGINDGMHHGMGQIEDKRFFRIALVLEEIDRLIRVKPGETTHVPRATGILIVFVEFHYPVIVGTQGTKVIIKSLRIRHARDDGLPV